MSLDANLKLVYAVDDGNFFTIDTVEIGEAFDVIANVEIGDTFMKFVDEHTVHVSIVNQSKSEQVASVTRNLTLAPSDAALNSEVRVDIPAGWTADVGDVLQVVASYIVRAGNVFDYSHAQGGSFIAR